MQWTIIDHTILIKSEWLILITVAGCGNVAVVISQLPITEEPRKTQSRNVMRCWGLCSLCEESVVVCHHHSFVLVWPDQPKFTFSTLAKYLLFTEVLVIFLIFICRRSIYSMTNRSSVVVPQSRDSCGGLRLRLRRKWEFDCHLSFHGNVCCSLIHELIFLPPSPPLEFDVG